MRGRTAEALRARFPGDLYLAFHAPRYAQLLTLLDDYVRPEMTVLDIGRSRLTTLLHEHFDVPVDTLGFDGDRTTPEGRDWWFDLNRSANESAWRTDLPRYDVIVMAEVIEHLHTAPRLVLEFLRSLLADRGILVIQTPNAAALHKRIELMIGRNPYELIRETTNDPGHFREYTRNELSNILHAAGFNVEHWFAAGYFDYRFANEERRASRAVGAVANAVYRVTPASLRPGQTVVARGA